MAQNGLDALKALTVVVADTGDFESFKTYEPQDVTTNPSLIYAASQQAQYASIVAEAVAFAKTRAETPEERVLVALDKIAVIFGSKALALIKGRVSTEIDARLSFDTEATIKKARELGALYTEMGIDYKTRVLFKIAATWEGIKAAEQLEKEGYHCNLTLLFSFAQAVACAEARVTLVSPFVGRILDFWKKELGRDSYPPNEDPGVVSVTQIYNYYKKFGYTTIVMGASFRSVEEITELAGCDYLTIAPSLLEKLAHLPADKVVRKLDASHSATLDIAKVTLDEKAFRWEMNGDACGTAKVAEGIRNFTKDIEKLQTFLTAELSK